MLGDGAFEILGMSENRGRPVATVAVEAVSEVGNPTVLATLTVIAAVLPMAFVRGLMGPYMEPIPVGASTAMAFSLLIAFVVTPWAAIRLLKTRSEGDETSRPEDRMTTTYRAVMGRLIGDHIARFSLAGLGCPADVVELAVRQANELETGASRSCSS